MVDVNEEWFYFTSYMKIWMNVWTLNKGIMMHYSLLTTIYEGICMYVWSVKKGIMMHDSCYLAF
jgi:hypothetical protein